MPLVTVVIPAFNRSNTLPRAIFSVLAQSCQDFEILVVDDGSNDNTSHILAGLIARDGRIHLIQHLTNLGAQAARNTGIRAANGKWIAFLDSDDYWLPQSLELRLNEAEQRKVEVVHTECLVMEGDGTQQFFRVPPLAGRVYHALLADPGPVFPSLLVSRRALEEIGYLDEQIKSYQEWDTAIRLAKQCQFGFINDPTFVYDRRNSDSMSKDTRRCVVGYNQVVNKHARSILFRLGPRALAKHYQLLSVNYRLLDDKKATLRCALLSHLLWPFRLRKVSLHLRHLLMRAGVLKERHVA